ncbi:MAG: hypothetical protein COA74_10410 [Gammaproteobacteria bacterium]|nr:MAG: hypothetical protein COA74_10410 [Gammaproteobacteria bacterium]
MELILGLIIAFIAGIFSGKFIAPNARHIKELEATIEENKKQHQSYKDNVAEHFSESAHLFGDITEKYRSLYEHMSTGAYGLCDRRNIPRELSTSHVNILAVESPDIAPKLQTNSDQESYTSASSESLVVDVSREGMSPVDPKSRELIQKNKSQPNDDQENTAEIIDLDTQRNEEVSANNRQEQAKDYAIKAKGVINHNSLNRDDVST